MMEKQWYNVTIRGRVNGRGRELSGTVESESPVWAAYEIVSQAWPAYDIGHDLVRVGEGAEAIRFILDSDEASRVFVTEHAGFEEMAVRHAAEGVQVGQPAALEGE